jgi:hypothetical protein
MPTDQLFAPAANPRLTRCLQRLDPFAGKFGGALDQNAPDWLRVGTSIDIAAPAHRVFACLRNLGCLCRWWPRAVALHPQPPGLCNVGDIALLQLSDGPALLKVLCYQPDRRIVLSLHRPGLPLLLEIGVERGKRGAADGTGEASQIRLQLEVERRNGAIASARQAFWLSLLSRRAASGLRQHLNWELGQL